MQLHLCVLKVVYCGVVYIGKRYTSKYGERKDEYIYEVRGKIIYSTNPFLSGSRNAIGSQCLVPLSYFTLCLGYSESLCHCGKYKRETI
jgi:hypothetical protein